jgi:hypothetical protein
LVPSFDGGDDFVGVLGPGKGLWVCVGFVEEAMGGIFEANRNVRFGPLGTEMLHSG